MGYPNIKNVPEAFELLNKTLQEERRRIYEAGSNAMKKMDAKVAREALDFAGKLESFQKDVQNLIVRWEELQKVNDIASPDVQKILVGEGRLFSAIQNRMSGYARTLNYSPAPPSGLNVRFPDGTVISEFKACDTFAKAITHIGPKRVASLGLILNGEPLIAPYPSQKWQSMANNPLLNDEERYRAQMRVAAYKKVEDGLYVNTHSNTKSKAEILKQISTELNLHLDIIVRNIR